ncbi:purine-nucleoside phosphorylase [Longibacter salinarum]|uniref:Purine nucleoside phosphorylase n=1 Tax=Longibacter salinarum TaxID=1850348 RepID=A0A2A8CXT2_9BACT|nr:purine-nucleoside phosphorylase [Longibacter salinarum]PEN13466.1 purine-nucleoside phosphorylase [Longibacter salinarum]
MAQDDTATAAAATDIETYKQHVEEAAAFLHDAAPHEPSVAIILGTGLGGLVDEMDVDATIPFEDLPHFPSATVESHEGKLIFGRLDNVPVLAMQGRLHLYEGYSVREATFPVRVMGVYGIEAMLISNAAGGMNPHFERGDLMLTTDHINFQGANPLVGPNVEEWGPRFPDMSEPYDLDLREKAEQIALDHAIQLHQGVYVSVLGPNLETPAEYRFLRQMGADVVGMSTVPEVIVARHMGLRVMAISVITDECFPDALEPVKIEEVLAAADQAAPHLKTLFQGVVSQIGTPVDA